MKLLRLINLLYLSLVILVFSNYRLLSQTADELKKAREFEQQANKAYQAKDFAGFLENTQRANQLRPNHPRILYNLADAYAMNGKTDDSLAILDKISNMGLYFPFEKDDDFKSLFELEKFKIMQQKTILNSHPVNHSFRAFMIPEKDLITEGIAYNPKTKTFFVSSIHQRKIIAIDQNGMTQDFSNSSDGLWSVSGMKVDVQRQILWVTSSAFPQMTGFQKSDEGKSGIFKYDLKTGKLINKYLLANEAEKHDLGDLTITKNGDVFSTDSSSPIIYSIDSGKDKLEVFLKDDSFESLQGLAFTPDEKILYIADYSTGISRIDIKTKKITPFKPLKDMALLGIDGLYLHNGKLIAIQNGIIPNRVVELSINSSNVTSCKTLEANHSDFNEPTLGVIAGNDFYYIANSQWSLVNDKGELNTEKLRSPVILRLPL